MIAAAVVQLCFVVVRAIVAVFPVVEIPAAVVSSLSSLVVSASALNAVLPVAEMFGALSFYLGFWIMILYAQVVIFVFRLIPVFGGH